MIPVDGQTMREVAPTFSGENGDRQARIIGAVGEILRSTLEEYDIANRLRIAHFLVAHRRASDPPGMKPGRLPRPVFFLGQTCVESAGFRTTEEFASGEAYEGRKNLGNVKKGDGPLFKGRGLIQLTGRANYEKYGKALGVDLENDPATAAEPALSLRIACEYWRQKKINDASDRDDIMAVTRLINGGTNGLEDRRTFTSRAKAAVARLEGVQLSGAASDADPRPVLHRGSKGDAVAQLQSLLRRLNFAVAVDGDFGPGTEVAVTRFQSETGMTADGLVGPETWAALDVAGKIK